MVLSTNPALISRVRRTPHDAQAWREFVATYGPVIGQWCRRRGLNDHDAEDVTQDVLARLARVIRSFVYDPSKSFRGWLHAVSTNVMNDFLADRARLPQGRGVASQAWDSLLAVEAREDFRKSLEDRYDFELFAMARDRVRLRVAERTWEAFRLSVLESRPVEEASRLSGLNVAMVYVARHKVQAMLREEIAKLDGEGEGS